MRKPQSEAHRLIAFASRRMRAKNTLQLLDIGDLWLVAAGIVGHAQKNASEKTKDDVEANPPCHPRACAIQDCLSRNNYDEAKCSDAVKALYDCCQRFYERFGDDAKTPSYGRGSAASYKLLRAIKTGPLFCANFKDASNHQGGAPAKKHLLIELTTEKFSPSIRLNVIIGVADIGSWPFHDDRS
ncbi:hypothetical protein CP532_4867 [Ophiocordyceps camponoti-leonardi (nom. inval.)]|nr:hypothetical protein CP532_4867 [Ophiocordyceps camponoti-leonardi (nom. inval.)]